MNTIINNKPQQPACFFFNFEVRNFFNFKLGRNPLLSRKNDNFIIKFPNVHNLTLKTSILQISSIYYILHVGFKVSTFGYNVMIRQF